MESQVTTQENKPHIVYDTSYLVQYGMLDLGALLALTNLKRKLEAVGYVEVIPKPVLMEYTKLFDNAVENEEGLPKASATTLKAIHTGTAMIEDITELRSPTQRDVAKELWSRFSRKALIGKGISTTDLDILSYVLSLAERDCDSFVFSFDEDVVAPLRELDASGKKVHPVTYTKDDNVSRLRLEGCSFLFLVEDTLKELYNLPKTIRAYMLSSRFQIGDVKGDVVWKIGSDFTGKKLEEECVRRFPLSIIDLGNIPNLRERNYEVLRKDENIGLYTDKKDWELVNQRGFQLSNMYKECRHFIAVRNKRIGVIGIFYQECGRKARASRTFNEVEVQWLLLPTNYLTGYHLDWYEPIANRILNFRE